MDYLNSSPLAAQTLVAPPYVMPLACIALFSSIAAVASAIFTSYGSLISGGAVSIALPITLCALFTTTALVSIVTLYILLKKNPQIKAPENNPQPQSNLNPKHPQEITPYSSSQTTSDSDSQSDSQLKAQLNLDATKNKGVDPSALDKLTLAANAGEVEAMYTLGMHFLNDPSDKDVEVGLEWLEKADKENFPGVKNFLSNYYYDVMITNYLEDSGLLADDDDLAQLYLKAASKGHAKAQYEYALCCLEGKGIDENEQDALNWLTESSQQDFTPAVLKLGEHLIAKESQEDKVKGMSLIKKAAEAKSALAEYSYGKKIKEGIGVEPDLKAGLEWIKKAADQGLLKAITQLGRCFFYGEGCDADHVEALRLFKQAAVQGCPKAQKYLHELFPTEDV